MVQVEYRDLGVMEYGVCRDYQQTLFDSMLDAKCGGAAAAVGGGYLLLVEHPAVYTLGKSGKEANLLRISDEDFLRSIGARYYHTDRGGDVTFHGRGQIVGYPILDLERLGISLRGYIEALEGAVMDCCAELGIATRRVDGASGVWIDDERGLRKICAIGVRASRYVTMHGFAMNVSTDLSYFNHINPCGFVDRGVTSVEKELGHEVDFDAVKALLVNCLEKKLNVKIYK